MKLLSFAAGFVLIVASGGCIVLRPGQIHGGHTYVFDLSTSGRNPTTQPTSEYVVFISEVHRQEAIGQEVSVKLTRLEMHRETGSRFFITLPTMSNSAWLENKFDRLGFDKLTPRNNEFLSVAIFKPGSRVLQFSLEGWELEPKSFAFLPDSNDGIGRKAIGPCPFDELYDHNGQWLRRLPYTKISSREMRCGLPLGPLPPSDQRNQVPDEWTNESLWRVTDRLKFAIRRGQLDHIDENTRRIVYDAIRRQVADPFFASAVNPHSDRSDYETWTNHERWEKEGLEPIAKWAGVDKK